MGRDLFLCRLFEKIVGKAPGDLLSNGLRSIDLRAFSLPVGVPDLPFTLYFLPFGSPGFVPLPEAGSLMMNEYPSVIPQGL